MGFFADWRAHWVYLGTELSSYFRRLRKTPGHTITAFWTHPLLFSFIYFIVGLYIDAVASVFTERTYLAHEHPLRDELFAFPYKHDYGLNNTLLYISVGVTALRFLPIWPCVKPAIARLVLRRWFFLQGTLFFLRAFSLFMTSDPAPDPQCVTTATGNMWLEGWKITFGVHSTCADCMFSGHTSAHTLVIMLWTRYSRGEEFTIFFGRRPFLASNVDAAGDPMGWKLTDVLLWAWALDAFYWIIATRFHYSHDVYLGFVVTFLLVNAYHLYLKTLSQRRGSVFARFMRWFEGINQAEQALQQEKDIEQQLQQGTDLVKPDQQQMGGSSACTTAHAQAAAVTSQNNEAIPAGSAKEVPPSYLPVSVLEGNNYYRPSAGTLKSDANKDAPADAYAKEDPRWDVGPYESAIRSNPARAAENPLHNHNLPLPVLTAGEQAEQELREVEREHKITDPKTGTTA